MNGMTRKLCWCAFVATFAAAGCGFGQNMAFAAFDKTAVVESNADIGALPPRSGSLEEAFASFARERGIDYTGKYRFATAEIRPENGKFAEATERAFADAFAKVSKEIDGTACPVMTRQDCKDGVWRVGVVVRKNDNLARLLQETAAGRRTLVVAEKGMPIAALLAGDATSMTQELGFRFFYDERGVPSLLSFAQADVSDAGQNPLERLRSRNAALKTAVEKSEKNIRDFLAKHNIEKAEPVRCIYREILRHPSGCEIATAASLWTFATMTSTTVGPLRMNAGEDYDF